MFGRSQHLMRKLVTTVLLVPFGLITGGIWGVVAHAVARDREPWFTGAMLCGLAVTIASLSWLCGVPGTTALFAFLGTGCVFVVLRLLFGKGSAVEMFAGPHIFAVLLLLIWPSVQRARERHRPLDGPSQRVQATPGYACVSFPSQWPGAPDPGCST
jgi:hypothetical protein